MAWIHLALAGVAEVVFVVGMKLSRGFERPAWVAVAAVFLLTSVGLLTLVAKALPISVAYPIWTAAGIFGSAIVGALAFGEAMSMPKLVGLTLIVAGVASLRVAA
ncbi:QacE family quaternary ammonium compound efflux SMR transporter [Spiribacter halobius]|uniref:Guanidinium exporter n=2 Tax=Sediminicurvatus halobius TaxID=2182432 RepID=A0A2U2N3F5_9GAMM|nr:QacE family quaternary ammonium compound efflux SMR transporter [Spiribacter halobius]